MQITFTGIEECGPTAGAAVVIDVLRAFSTAAYAMAWGAEGVLLARSNEEALSLAACTPRALSMKDGAPDPAFDLVNSPGHLQAVPIRGRIVVQKTTAGTVGAHAAAAAPLLLCASFVNARATARHVITSGMDTVTFVVTGDDGRADDDLACAEYITRLVRGTEPAIAAPFVERAARSSARADLERGLAAGYQGIHPDDVGLCLQADVVPLALVGTKRGAHIALEAVPMA